MSENKYPIEIQFEITSDNQYNIMLALYKSFQGDLLNIDKFLFWIIKNMNVEQSAFLNKYNK